MKIFNLSLCKSGTTSLEKFLEQTYNLKSYPYISKFYMNKSVINEVFNNKDFSKIPNINDFDSFSDIPFNLFDSFKYFEKKFPDAKFILIIRNLDDWVDSNIRWQEKLLRTSHKGYLGNIFFNYQYYGAIQDNKVVDVELLKKAYNDYHESIFKYFENKKDKLLIMNLEKIEIDKIYSFISLPIKNKISFKKLNVNNIIKKEEEQKESAPAIEKEEEEEQEKEKEVEEKN